MNNKTILICHSLTGFTQKYANLISAATGCDVVSYAKRNKADLSQYDAVIFGSSFHMGHIRNFKWFKQQLPALQGKKIAVYCTGAMPGGAEDAAKVMHSELTDEEREHVATFYMPGGLCYERMGALDRFLMAGFRSMVKKTEGEDSVMYQTIIKSYDLTDETAIDPLVAWLRGE